MPDPIVPGVDSHDGRLKYGWLVLFVALLLAMERPASGSAPQPARENASGSSQAEPTTTTILQQSDDQEPLVWAAADPAQDKKWEFKDAAGWKFVDSGGERVLSQFLKSSDYKPPHRSPLHIALLKDHKFESFQLDAWVKSTHAEYGHRDVCLFFGYAAPDKFYYVHMASEMDDRANQIFLVNQADRIKISATTTTGTRWDDRWHHVRLTRDAKTGEITVFFDDMNQPVMTAVDKTIGPGQIGFGSFDDTVDFKRLEIRGR